MTEPATNDTVQPIARRRAALAFIFVTVLIDMMAFGLIIPVLPHLIQSYTGDVSSAAIWYGYFSTAYFAMQFVFAPVQGALSDWKGRRPVILLSNLGLGLDFIMMAMVNTLPFLFIGRIISGITAASFSTSNAYVADVTPPEKRAQSFGMMGLAFGIGFVVAPAIGGLLGEYSLRLPFWVAVVLCLANFMYGYFVLPESLPPERRTRNFDWAHANPFGVLKLLRRYPQVIGLLGVLFLMALAHLVYPTTFVLYAEYRFDWGVKMVGITLAIVGALGILVQLFLIKPIVRNFGERRALLLALAFGTVGFALYALMPTGYWFWAVMPVAALWGIAGPAAQAIMTHHVHPTEQGRLQGAVASLSSIAGMLAPTLFTNVFAAVTKAHLTDARAGATFWLASAMVGASWLLAWYTVSHLPRALDAGIPSPASTSEILSSNTEILPPVPEGERPA